MRSLILTILYLAKDTIHRWLMRLSSPVARVLVVFFLSLCAFCFLGSYVVSAKLLREQIQRQGGDRIILNCFSKPEQNCFIPNAKDCRELFQADSFALNYVGMARLEDGKSLRCASYSFSRQQQYLPYLSKSGRPTLLLPPTSRLAAGPSSVSIMNQSIDAVARKLAPDDPLLELAPTGVLLISPDTLAQFHSGHARLSSLLWLRLTGDNVSSQRLRQIEAYLKQLLRLEGVEGQLSSAAPLLERLEQLLDKQMQCRSAFCFGIACIVGILLTAIAGMEYRQNEYIYTLMKSFGIHPLLLLAAFIAENSILVGAAFAAAYFCFMGSQHYILERYFQLGRHSLLPGEIAADVRFIALALVGCVLISSIPILMAINREIGRVLK